MWAGMLHLLVGNIVIGILEGGLIAFFLGIRKRIAIPLLICANYASTLAGLFLIPLMQNYIFIPEFGRPSLYNVGRFLWLFYISLFLITVVIEWPFCFLAMFKLAGRFKKSLYASCAVQAVSYLLLIPFYFGASATSLFAKLERDPSLVKTCTDKATILFIHPENGDVYRIQPNGTGLEKVLTLGAQDPSAKLFFRRHEGSETGDLWVQTDYSEKSEKMLLPKFAANASQYRDVYEREHQGSYFDRWLASDFRPEDKQNPEVRAGFWAAEGIHVRERGTDDSFRLAFEVPFLMNWISRNAAVLPSERVIYQLGPQIVLLDLNSRKIGLITMGRGPVVILDEPTRAESE
jgi:hypothetical protein